MMFRQAIRVKYLCPTNHKGARYSASCAAKRITRSRAYGLNAADDAARVAKELATLLKWHGNWAGGQLDNGDYVFVMINDSRRLASDGFYVAEFCQPQAKKMAA
jgi:hypothetical protein